MSSFDAETLCGGALPAFGPEDLDPGFAAALAENTPAAWREVVDEPFARVYTFRLLTDAALARFDREIDERANRARAAGLELEAPNGMHEYGFVLDGLGFRARLEDVMSRLLAPLCRSLYPDLGGGELDQHHGFLVEYARDKDEDLGFHVDDSEVTLNLCLGREFEGGDLYFRGLRCPRHMQTLPEPHESYEYPHEPGVALIHAGKHRHGVDYLRSGLRRNLILWCRNSSYREQANVTVPCPEWCGRFSG